MVNRGEEKVRVHSTANGTKYTNKLEKKSEQNRTSITTSATSTTSITELLLLR